MSKALNADAEKLGAYLRQFRENRNHSLVRAREEFDVPKNRILDYEHGRQLPDLTFLALHALEYKSDFATLLVLRLNADPHENVRKLVEHVQLVKPHMLRQPQGHLRVGLNIEVLFEIIQAVEEEEKRWRGRRLTPKQKARFIGATYNVLSLVDKVPIDAIRLQVSTLRPVADDLD